MPEKRRSGYIDIVKFVFAVIIAEFHLQTGIFPGGRIAVEGFFMISAYLMMKYIERDQYPKDNLGVSTVRFIGRKYAGLFPFLLPSALIAYVVYALAENRTLASFVERFPRLLFEIVPLRETGIHGIHVLGISWYLSAMFLVLWILYPLCKKFRSAFTLYACPLIFVIGYGILSQYYGTIAVTTGFLDNALFSSGVYRALAASAAGCLIYEISVWLSQKEVLPAGRALFTILEIAGFAYFFYAMHNLERSQYDFVLVFVVFGLLIIGINELSATSFLLHGKWTKMFGTASTLIVLNHYCWFRYLPTVFGDDYTSTYRVFYYPLAIIFSSVVVLLLSKLIRHLMTKGTGAFLYTPR